MPCSGCGENYESLLNGLIFDEDELEGGVEDHGISIGYVPPAPSQGWWRFQTEGNITVMWARQHEIRSLALTVSQFYPVNLSFYYNGRWENHAIYVNGTETVTH